LAIGFTLLLKDFLYALSLEILLSSQFGYAFMAPLSIFKRKKEEKVEKKEEKKTLLEELCKGNKELYNALSRTLLLNVDSTKSAGGIDKRIERAQEYEEKIDHVRASIEYQVAGELALFEGKKDLAQKFFQKAAEVDPSSPYRSVLEFLAKKENTEKAIAVAKEYYAHTPKST